MFHTLQLNITAITMTTKVTISYIINVCHSQKRYLKETQPHTHTRLAVLCPGLPSWAGTCKVKPIWILPKQETVSGSGISWAACKSAPRSRQITTPAPHHSVFLQAGCPSAAQPTVSRHWRQLKETQPIVQKMEEQKCRCKHQYQQEQYTTKVCPQ